MPWRTAFHVHLLLLLLLTGLAAREWRSADGSRSVQAQFHSLQQDRLNLISPDKKPLTLELARLSAEDQAFARAAQQVTEEAAKLVPVTFEIRHVLDEGWLCLAGRQDPPKTGPWIFSGDPFLWLVADPKSGGPGDRMENQRLFPAGLRTLHPASGDPLLIRAYAADAETAAADTLAVMAASGGDATKQAPPVHEPRVEISTVRGLGLAVGKDGRVIVQETLVKDADRIMIHANKNQFSAKVVKRSEKNGFALLSCDTTLEPGRFAARKELELGQPVFAVSFVLGSTRKSLTQPIVSKGIISRPAGGSSAEFQHDAAIPPESLGGYIVGEKGDVLGLFFTPLGAEPAKPSDSGSSAKAAALNAATTTQALADFSASVPDLGPLRPAASAGIERSVESLRSSTVLVTVTRRIITQIKAGAGGQFSLSSSGVRHNAQCRYFRADKPCGPNDGKPCGICGG